MNPSCGHSVGFRRRNWRHNWFNGGNERGSGFNNDIIFDIVRLSFLLILVVESVLIWLLVRQQIGAKKINDNKRTSERTTQEINPTDAHLLPEPATSVTEHTTRTFDPVYVERKAK